MVGYGAFAMEYAASARLDDADRALLLSTAMASLAAAARQGGRAPAVALDGRLSPTLTAWRGTFVTLTEDGRLRGCIGSPAPRMALIEDVAANAVQAGFGDPRFAPLSEDELDGLELDVSILSHPRPIPARARPNSSRRWSQIATGSFWGSAAGARCSCRASGARSPTGENSCAIFCARPGSTR